MKAFRETYLMPNQMALNIKGTYLAQNEIKMWNPILS